MGILTNALRALAAALYRRRVRRVMDSLDGCDFCGQPGEAFLDVTPGARHVTARLACAPCQAEALRVGAAVLMGADGRPVTYGRA